MRVFADYDGTITDVDTFDVLVKGFAGAHVWEHFESQLETKALTLRQTLAAQAALLRCTLDEADDVLVRTTKIDPAFTSFVAACERNGVAVTILSSGLGPLIERALARSGLSRVPLISNGALPGAQGWNMEFRDDSDLGHDKVATITSSRMPGETIVYIGDGISDYEASLVADRRFARSGRALERFLHAQGVPFSPFESFAEIEAALFG